MKIYSLFGYLQSQDSSDGRTENTGGIYNADQLFKASSVIFPRKQEQSQNAAALLLVQFC